MFLHDFAELGPGREGCHIHQPMHADCPAEDTMVCGTRSMATWTVITPSRTPSKSSPVVNQTLAYKIDMSSILKKALQLAQ